MSLEHGPEEFTLALRLEDRRGHPLRATSEPARPLPVLIHLDLPADALALDDHQAPAVQDQVIDLTHVPAFRQTKIIEDEDVLGRPEGPVEVMLYLPLSPQARRQPAV